MKKINEVISESSSAFTSAARVLVGLLILGTGVATFFAPEFRQAFINQLDAAHIPLQRLSLFVIPTLEGVAGAMLLGGLMIRVGSMVSMFIMALLTYLHIVAGGPSLFPTQLGFPLIPIIGLILSAFLYFVESYGDED